MNSRKRGIHELVVGATGLVGTEICRLIAASGKPVRALVRASSDAAKVENLKRLGATVVQGDLRDGISLKAACHGVKAVISTASARGAAEHRLQPAAPAAIMRRHGTTPERYAARHAWAHSR